MAYHAEIQPANIHSGRNSALEPTQAQPSSSIEADDLIAARPDVYKREVVVPFDLLSPRQKASLLAMMEDVEVRRASRISEAAPFLATRAADLVPAVIAAGTEDHRQELVRRHVQATAREFSSEELAVQEKLVEASLSRVKKLGFWTVLTISRTAFAHRTKQRDDLLAERNDLRHQLVEQQLQRALDSVQYQADFAEHQAEAALYALTVDSAFSDLLSEHTGEITEMLAIEAARNAANAVLPEDIKPIIEETNRVDRISTDQLEAMASRVTHESVSPALGTRLYPRAMGGAAVVASAGATASQVDYTFQHSEY
jgi:hypothetical protein